MTSDWLGEADGNTVQPFVSAKSEIKLQDIRIGGNLLGLRRRCDETRSGQHSKRSSTPTKDSGGIIAAWMAPNWVPSICRGMVPSWLAG